MAEQQITAWGNIYLELGVGILFFLIGLYFILRNPTTRNIFYIVFAVTALFFAASMIRLLAIFAPAFAIIAAVGILSILKPFYTLLKESPRSLAKTKRKLARVSKEYSGVAIFLIFLILSNRSWLSLRKPEESQEPSTNLSFLQLLAHQAFRLAAQA